MKAQMQRRPSASEREPNRIKTDFFLGLDLGQSTDPSALTVTEKRVPLYQKKVSGDTVQTGPPTYAVRWIQRFDLGTPYQEVVSRVTEVKEAPQTGESPPLVMDATGVGQPVTEMFKAEGLRPQQVIFTSGDTANRSARTHRVPKKDLATTVQSLLQSGRITIAEDLEHAPSLVTEMKRFRVKMTDAGNARFEHANESDSDDILLSLACALWYAESGSNSVYKGELITF